MIDRVVAAAAGVSERLGYTLRRDDDTVARGEPVGHAMRHVDI